MPTVAVVGAGSLLGREILLELEARARIDRVQLLSERAAGTELPFRGEEVVVEELDQGGLDEALAAKPEAVIFTPGAARAAAWAKRFAEAGLRTIDLSAAHRRDPLVPLLGLAAPGPGRLFSVPGAAPLAVARLLGPALKSAPAPQLAAALLFPVSSAGQPGVLELSGQTASLLGGRTARAKLFSHRIAFNVLPQVGKLTDGESAIELSFRDELRRLLGLPQLPLQVTAVRVPVFFGLSLVLSGQAGALETIRAGLNGRPAWVKPLLGDDAYPMPSLSIGDAAVLAGRLRGDGAGGFELFATVDPLRLVAQTAVDAAVGNR